VERLVESGLVSDLTLARQVEQSLERLRNAGQLFFTELAFAHRGDSRPKSEERIRATGATLLATRDAAFGLTGALEDIAAILLRARPTPTSLNDDASADGAAEASSSSQESEPEDDGFVEQVTTLARRATELRDDLRLLVRADDEAYVYFVEFRG